VPRRPFRPGRAGSLAYIACVYVLAVALAWWVFHAVDAPPLLAMALGLLASTSVTYAFTLHADNGSVFDAWWSVMPPFAALYMTGLSGHAELTPRQVALHAVVWFWAVRLTVNWARGWSGLDHEDWRYVQLARQWPLPRWAVRLLAVEIFPALIVTLGCLPLYPALALGDDGFGWLDGLALAIGIAAVATELVADEQLHSFARTRQPGELLDRGLWRYARHPNYFGEIAFWVSLWLFGLSAAPGWWWTGVGVLAMIGMFVSASVPMLDERSRERRPGFAAYAARTRAIVPWPRRRDAPGTGSDPEDGQAGAAG
jgi:steroid 5-alpha reductase family enzyme